VILIGISALMCDSDKDFRSDGDSDVVFSIDVQF
jgi:hypothetical protein